MKKVLISGYYGFHNTGDEAILETLCKELSDAGLEVDVLSAEPEKTQNRYNVRAFNRANVGEVIRAVRNCDVLLSGGGSLFQDVTSSASLYYYLGIVILGLIMRKDVHIYSQGIGPINKRFNRKLFSMVISKAKSISVRDAASYDKLVGLGVNRVPTTVTSDPVFLLEAAPAEQGAAILTQAGLDVTDPNTLVGLAVRPWGDRETASGNFAEIADRIIEEFNAKLVLFPFHHPGDLDFTFEIVNKMKHKPFILDKQYLPSQIMSAMGLMHMNIGVRLHALILSACMGVPMIGISYDPKIDGFLNSMGLNSVCTYQNLQWDKIKEEMINISSNRASVIEAITRKTQESRELARKNLNQLLEEINR